MGPETSDSPELCRSPLGHSPGQARERVIALVVIGLVLLYVLWLLRVEGPSENLPMATGSNEAVTLSPATVPLATGEEPVVHIFTKAGCLVCHIIPGIPGVTGQVGPRLVLGTTGEQCLRDPLYGGHAKTVHDYVVESVLEPERFIVPGYPERTMPPWYGSKLSALALEKIARYLEQQTEGKSDR